LRTGSVADRSTRSLGLMRTIVAAMTTAILAGCFPISGTYLRIDAPEARYFGSSCHGVTGPPAVVYFPFHGAFISLSIDSAVLLGFHLPAGTTGQLNGGEIKVEGESAEVVQVFHIAPTSRGSLGTVHPDEFYRGPDLCWPKAGFGPFVGETKNGGHAWCMFTTSSHSEALPRGLTSGVIEIPSVTVNGIRYETQRIPFKRQSYVNWETINC
jgi:hypothetical protein